MYTTTTATTTTNITFTITTEAKGIKVKLIRMTSSILN